MEDQDKDNKPTININANPSATLEIAEFLHTMAHEKGDEQKINRVDDEKEKADEKE